METIISNEDCRNKLLCLKEHFPHARNTALYDFAHYVATYIEGVLLSPQEFVIRCKSAVFDLKNGTDLKTGKPLESSLVKQLHTHVSWGDAFTRIIAKILFPKDFFKKVKDEMKIITRRKKQQQLC